LGVIQNIAAQPRAQRSGQEPVSGENQPEDGSEMSHTEAVAGQRCSDCKQGSKGVADNCRQGGPQPDTFHMGHDQIGNGSTRKKRKMPFRKNSNSK